MDFEVEAKDLGQSKGGCWVSSHTKYSCIGLSLKIWLSRRKFFWAPRAGLKSQILGHRGWHGKRPYHAFLVNWLCFDVCIYLPKLGRRCGNGL